MRKIPVIQYPKLAKEFHPTKNNLLAVDVGVASTKLVWWKCPVADDHEWQARPSDRVNKNSGCPFCANKKVCRSNCLATTHPNLSYQWDYNKNTLNPYQITAGSTKKIWWKCPVADDHEWLVSPQQRSWYKLGCPYCSGKKVARSTSLGVNHPDIAAQWDESNKLTPFDIGTGSEEDIRWVCKNNPSHKWIAKVYMFVNNWMSNNGKTGGCPYCRGRKVCHDNYLSLTHPQMASQWCYEKNSTTPEQITKGSGVKVWWECPVADDHVWYISPRSRIKGDKIRGCPFCQGLKASKTNCLANYPDLVREWDKTKNKIEPSAVVAGSEKKFWWICEKGHCWQTSPGRRIYGKTGCPVCKESKGEKKIREYLIKYGIKYKPQCKFSSCKLIKELPFDFVVNYNEKIACIEYQGRQHFDDKSGFGASNWGEMFKKIIQRDAIKKQWCEDKNIPLLTIPYWEYININKIIDNFLKNLT